MRFLHTQLKNRFLHFKIYFFSFSEKYNIKKYRWGKYIYILLARHISLNGRTFREKYLFPCSPVLTCTTEDLHRGEGSHASPCQISATFIKRSLLLIMSSISIYPVAGMEGESEEEEGVDRCGRRGP